ncbi:predicted protein [Histoplasma capsulatum H143]|uniref:Uncharacterized protein n=1 Tax=Ajellomyces capsulatus (strain H143) TaxID=544712 RepID=C6HLL5_AJECH|nr:predicted protein [Histoplasma capsulatum H143]
MAFEPESTLAPERESNVSNTGLLTSKQELYETSGRSSPSKTSDPKIYFLEFCKAFLIRHQKIPENIAVSGPVAICMDRGNLITLAFWYLQCAAKAIECIVSLRKEKGPTSAGTYLSLAHKIYGEFWNVKWSVGPNR